MLVDRSSIAITVTVLQAVGFACCSDPGRSLAVYHPDWQFFVKKFASSSGDERQWTSAGALLDPSLSSPSPSSTPSVAKGKTFLSPHKNYPRENSVPEEDDRARIPVKPFARRLIFAPQEDARRDNRGNKSANKQSRHRHHRHRNRKERRRKKPLLRPVPSPEVPIFDGGESGLRTIVDIDTNPPHLSTSLDVRDQLVLNRSAQVLRKNIRIAPLEVVRRLLSDPQASA